MADKSPLEKNKPTRTNRNTTNPPKKNSSGAEVYAPNLPSLLSVPNTKVSNIFDTLLDKDTQLVEVGNGVLTSIKAYFMPLTDGIPDNIRLRSPAGKSRTYTEFDRAILGAVASLVRTGNNILSPATIARFITGCPNAHDFSDTFLRQIDESMQKQLYIHIELDYTEELRRKHPDADIRTARLEGWSLPHERYVLFAGGYETQGYRLHDEPILFRYADAIDQVLPIPLSYLAVGGRNSAERVALKHYMLRRILARKGTMPDTILLSTLYEKAGYPDTSKTTRKHLQSLREYIGRCMTAWVELGLLDEFDFIRGKNGSYTSLCFKKSKKVKAPKLPEPPELPPEPPADTPDEPYSEADDAQLIISNFGRSPDGA